MIDTDLLELKNIWLHLAQSNIVFKIRLKIITSLNLGDVGIHFSVICKFMMRKLPY